MSVFKQPTSTKITVVTLQMEVSNEYDGGEFDTLYEIINLPVNGVTVEEAKAILDKYVAARTPVSGNTKAP